MARRNRSRKQGRQRPSRGREILDVVYIICEGEAEKHYFNHLKSLFPRLREMISVKIIPLGNEGDADLLWEKAKKKCDDEDALVFFVYDCEPHDRDRCKIAASVYKKLGGHPKEDGRKWRPIVSHPSFDIWLLLHHHSAWKVDTPKQAKTALNKHFPGCDLPRGPFRNFDPLLEQAMNRAESLWKQASKDLFPQKRSSAIHFIINYLNKATNTRLWE